MTKCSACAEGLHRHCAPSGRCHCGICTYLLGAQLGHVLWRAAAEPVRRKRFSGDAASLVQLEEAELAGHWRRRGDRFCPLYRIEEYVPGRTDAELLLQEADGGPHTVRLRLSYLRSLWELAGS